VPLANARGLLVDLFLFVFIGFVLRETHRAIFFLNGAEVARVLVSFSVRIFSHFLFSKTSSFSFFEDQFVWLISRRVEWCVKPDL
jgi:hypothetical protein